MSAIEVRTGAQTLPVMSVTLMLGHRLFEDNINVQPILAPAVPDNESRLRFFITCDHSEEEMAHCIERTVSHLQKIRQQIH